ncbi:MAG TPA: four helix bundle protein [Lacibacter sp.]|nr:four helix bundle protein [Lacibacter sp.]
MSFEKNLFAEAFKERTKKNAVEIIKLYRSFPKTDEARIAGKQLIRSATSVAANYRAACRARSKAEFHAKISTCVEEADETVFWLEITEESEIYKSDRLKKIKTEAGEILKIVSAARKTVSS